MKMVAVNENLEDAPELVNEDCYQGGWIIKIKPSDPTEMDGLMDKTAYLEMLKG